MKPDDFSGIDVAYYRLRLRALEDASLPEFIGSTLRGGFGHALKHAVCVMSHKSCERCLVQDRCLYPYIFETPTPTGLRLLEGQQQAPHPFILTPLLAHADREAIRTEQDFDGAAPDIKAEVAVIKRRSVPPASANHVPLITRGAAVEYAASRAASHEAISAHGFERKITNSEHTAEAGTISSRALPKLIKRSFLSSIDTGGLHHDLGPGRRTLVRAGDSLSFDLTLMGRAIDYLPYIVLAITEMGRRGLGVSRSQFELDEVTSHGIAGETSIYTRSRQTLATPPGMSMSLADWIRARLIAPGPRRAPSPSTSEAERSNSNEPPPSISNAGSNAGLFSASSVKAGQLFKNNEPVKNNEPLKNNEPPSSIRIAFLTPTRIRIDGDPQAEMSFELLVRNLLRRISLLCAVHGQKTFEADFRGLIEQAREVRISKAKLRWWDFERYSNRQKTKMKLGGFVGEIEYEGAALIEFLPLITAGELLHVGSNTTFGLGAYRIMHMTDCNYCEEVCEIG